MATLCFGGSFDPVHMGHLTVARAVAEALGFDRVALIPTAVSPFKRELGAASPQQRLEMTRLAAEGSELLYCDDIEIVRGGPSFTIDTARALRERGMDEVFWLIGSDLVASLGRWHEAEALLREVRFVVVERPGFVVDRSTMGLEVAAMRQEVVSVPQIDISSTQIRNRIAKGLSIDYLTPASVVGYIREQGLYRDSRLTAPSAQ